MAAECNGCGDCCDPVFSPAPHVLEKFLAEGNEEQRSNAAFILAKWEPLAPVDDGFRYVYRCTVFDEATRRCTDYENRPTLCRRFPWFDAEGRRTVDPFAGRLTGLDRCSYWLDVPEDQRPEGVPIPVELRSSTFEGSPLP